MLLCGGRVHVIFVYCGVVVCVGIGVGFDVFVVVFIGVSLLYLTELQGDRDDDFWGR